MQAASTRTMKQRLVTGYWADKKLSTKRKLGAMQSPLVTKRIKSMSTQSPLLTRKSQRLRKLSLLAQTTTTNDKGSQSPSGVSTPHRELVVKKKIVQRQRKRREGVDSPVAMKEEEEDEEEEEEEDDKEWVEDEEEEIGKEKETYKLDARQNGQLITLSLTLMWLHP